MTKTWNRFRLAPAIATFIIIISFHILFFLDDPLQFLIGLIKPSIIFPMLALMCVALVLGYVIGILPAYLTSKIFYKLLGDPQENMHRSHYLKCGALATLLWSPLLIFGVYGIPILIPIVLFLLIVVFPTTLICAELEWRAHQKKLIIRFFST